MKPYITTPCILIAACALLLAGCADQQVGAALLTDEKLMQEHAKDYWVVHNVPPIHKSAQRKVAVAEFDVEFITECLETNSSGKGEPFVAKLTDYGQGLKMELPGMLYSMLQDEGNMNLLQMDVVNETKGSYMATMVQYRDIFIQARIQRDGGYHIFSE